MKTNENIVAANPNLIRARAPGKIILSGEHAVVYGSDALAVAVNEYTTVNFSPISHSKAINTIFSGISSSVIYPINALSKLKHRLDERFEKFTRGDFPVQNILNHPNDLVMYTLMSFLQQLPSRKTLQQFAPHSGVLRSESSIPLGAGMGSSASAIAATLVLYEHILEKPLDSQKRLEMVRFCERLQHGKGSAIDAAAVTLGGIIHLHNQIPKRLANQPEQPFQQDGWRWLWINTGTPLSSTGVCVQQVRQNHANDTSLWNDFNETTMAFIEDITQQKSPISVIKKNHQLLTQIGVVSDSAQKLISLIENSGGAAKVSGAGTIKGDKSGLILAYLPHDRIDDCLATIEQQLPNYNKAWNTISLDNLGARVIHSTE